MRRRPVKRPGAVGVKVTATVAALPGVRVAGRNGASVTVKPAPWTPMTAIRPSALPVLRTRRVTTLLSPTATSGTGTVAPRAKAVEADPLTSS